MRCDLCATVLGLGWCSNCAAEANAASAEIVKPVNPTGFTPEIRALCLGRCATYGDPPCWKLPDLVKPCELITPCADCAAGKPVDHEDL